MLRFMYTTSLRSCSCEEYAVRKAADERTNVAALPSGSFQVPMRGMCVECSCVSSGYRSVVALARLQVA